VPRELEVPPGTLGDLITETVATYPRNVALEFFGRETSYAELGEQIEHAAEGLRRLGVKPGDRVALILPNCPQHVVAFYAILRLGGVVVEHNPLYTSRELRHQFEDHRARFAIAWDKTVSTLQDFPRDLALDAIVSVDMTRAFPLKMRMLLKLPIEKARSSRAELTTEVQGTVPWESLVGGPALPADVPVPDSGSLALIQYTSGTTGNPKGVNLSHRNLVANAAQARAWVPSIPRGTASVHAVLPLFHAYGLTLCLTFAMSMGARLVLFPKPDPDLVLPVFKKRPPTFLPAVPPLYDRLRKAAEAKGVSLEGIEIASASGMERAWAIV
jgi:long-chain acyl-CoA synthetase